MFDQVEAFYRPASVAEALRLLAKGRGRARMVAGGTDVVVEGGGSVRYLIDLQRAIIVDVEATPARWSAEVAATKHPRTSLGQCHL